MTPVGETLRRERMRRNLEIEQIARETKISARMLEAIEQERFEKLPGGVFAKSFVRQYARYLGLDEVELVGEVDRVLNPAPFAAASSTVKEPPPLPRVEEWQAVGEGGWKWSSTLPALALVVLVMLACSLVYNWWQNRRARPAETSAAVQQETVRQEQRPEAPPAQQPAVQAAAPAPDSSAAPAAETAPAAPQQQAPAPATTPVTAAAPAAASSPSSSTPNGADPNAPVRVEITAAEDVWISVRGDGKYLFSGTLKAGQTRTASGGESVSVRLGNAGGVSLSLNGKPVGPVGPKGQVRTVQFTSGGFQIVPPAPAAPKAPALDPFL